MPMPGRLASACVAHGGVGRSERCSLKKEKHALVAEDGPVDDGEMGFEGAKEVVFAKLAVEGFATAQPFLIHGIGDGNPFKEKPAPSQGRAELCDVGKRKLFAQNEVMDHRQQQDEVEFSGEPLEQGKLFSILPSCGGSGASNIGDQSGDGEFVLSCRLKENFESSGIAIERDYAGM